MSQYLDDMIALKFIRGVERSCREAPLEDLQKAVKAYESRGRFVRAFDAIFYTQNRQVYNIARNILDERLTQQR